jgi:hypothetical protein
LATPPLPYLLFPELTDANERIGSERRMTYKVGMSNLVTQWFCRRCAKSLFAPEIVTTHDAISGVRKWCGVCHAELVKNKYYSDESKTLRHWQPQAASVPERSDSVPIQHVDRVKGFRWEDHEGKTVNRMLNGLSEQQQSRIRRELGIPEDMPLLKHNPRTHFHIPDYESGYFAWDSKVRSGQLWRQDAHRTATKFQSTHTKRAVSSPIPLQLQEESMVEWTKLGIENLPLLGIMNVYRDKAGVPPITSCDCVGVDASFCASTSYGVPYGNSPNELNYPVREDYDSIEYCLPPKPPSEEFLRSIHEYDLRLQFEEAVLEDYEYAEGRICSCLRSSSLRVRELPTGSSFTSAGLRTCPCSSLGTDKKRKRPVPRRNPTSFGFGTVNLPSTPNYY